MGDIPKTGTWSIRQQPWSPVTVSLEDLRSELAQRGP